MRQEPSTENPKPKARLQDAAQKKLDHARKMIGEKTRAMRRLATSLRLWERRATYYAKRASMTDAEIAAENAARTARQNRRPKRRAIQLIAAGGQDLS